MGDLLLSSPAVLGADDALGPGWVRLLEDGSVAEVGPGAPPGTPDLEVAYLTPAFVDIHCHGGGGSSFATTDPAEAEAAASTHRAHGTGSLIASLVTAPLDELEAQVRALVPLVHDGVLAGLHLEGPWLSPRFAGAHDPRWLTVPRVQDVKRLLAAAEGHLRMVTLAPELPGALDAIRLLTRHGVTAAVGHTDTDEVGLQGAVEAGARVVTHLTSAMRPIHHRSPGPVLAALADERLSVELIADGVHVHPDVLSLLTRAARSLVVLVTDAMPAAAAPDGRYRLGSREVEVIDGVARLPGEDALAGSTLTMDRAVRTAVASGTPVASALASATRLPARAVGLGRSGPGAPPGVLGAGATGVLALDEGLRIVHP